MTTPYDTFKDSEREFVEKFPYHAVEYGKDFEVTRSIFPEIISHHRTATVALLDAVIAEEEAKKINLYKVSSGVLMAEGKMIEYHNAAKSDTITMLNELREKISSNE